MHTASRVWHIRLLTLTALAAGLSVTDARAAEPAPKLPVYDVRRVPDVAYYEGPDADPIKHKLDLYLPVGKKDFPVIFFIHGGAWRHGDKGWLGIYRGLGTSWARHGIGAVVINYRLTPKVRHPEHIKDVARAYAWTYRNMVRYGGRPDQIFVGGHSAGGHLAALLATDDRYLKAEGLTLKTIRGVMPMSGVYDIADHIGVLDAAFGPDRKAHRDASPLCHARADAPPFLIIYADHDLPLCGKETAEAFGKALRDKGCTARCLEVVQRNHMTVLLGASKDADPVARAIRAFVAEVTEPSRPPMVERRRTVGEPRANE